MTLSIMKTPDIGIDGMMKAIFLWFYCLPIVDAAMLMVLATAVWRRLRVRLGQHSAGQASIFVLFLCWMAVILFGTLGQRTVGSAPAEPILIPFYSYHTVLHGGSEELLRENFMNVVLFYPAGLLGHDVLPRRWKTAAKVLLTAAFFCMVSAGIEYVQYRFSMGLAEVDDVIHNTLGTATGTLAGGISINRNKNHPHP